MAAKSDAQLFPGCVELAAARIGGKALLASDDFFAPKENLLNPGRGIFIPEKFTSRGKWMDGWESRRKRVAGHDWCILRLGIPGELHGVDIDTNHFLGNHPPHASLEGLSAAPSASGSTLARAAWTPLLKKSPLKRGSQNIFKLGGKGRFTHVRLNIFPDGGVARLRIYGQGRPSLKPGLIDLASILNGGCVTLCNDMFFGAKDNLTLPGRAKNMGDGWETKRKRGPGHDWVILRLARASRLKKIELDTNHFKGNFPDRASVQGTRIHGDILTPAQAKRAKWTTLIAPTKLRAHHRRYFTQLLAKGPFTHLRLNIFPDGGISRLRAWGHIA